MVTLVEQALESLRVRRVECGLEGGLRVNAFLRRVVRGVVQNGLEGVGMVVQGANSLEVGGVGVGVGVAHGCNLQLLYCSPCGHGRKPLVCVRLAGYHVRPMWARRSCGSWVGACNVQARVTRCYVVALYMTYATQSIIARIGRTSPVCALGIVPTLLLARYGAMVGC